jgi:hypothetical protein
MVPLVMRQARARIFHGNTHVEGKLSPACSSRRTEVIRKPNEFGKIAKLRKPRIRSSSTMRPILGDPTIRTC